MKKFIIEIPEGTTSCNQCPFWRNYDVCTYLSENKHCDNYNFETTYLWELEEYNKTQLELENTEFDYGHNIKNTQDD